MRERRISSYRIAILRHLKEGTGFSKLKTEPVVFKTVFSLLALFLHSNQQAKWAIQLSALLARIIMYSSFFSALYQTVVHQRIE